MPEYAAGHGTQMYLECQRIHGSDTRRSGQSLIHEGDRHECLSNGYAEAMAKLATRTVSVDPELAEGRVPEQEDLSHRQQ